MNNVIRGTAQGPHSAMYLDLLLSQLASVNIQKSSGLQEGLTKWVSFLEIYSMVCNFTEGPPK